ncbi:MAG: PQ-loop domain-containing transporter [Acidimicrobiia bacterium]
MSGNLAAVALIAATVLAAVSLIPQILKLVRTVDPAGVSATWPAIGGVTNAAWSVYLVHQGLWPASISTTLMVVFYGVVLWALRRAGTDPGMPLLRGVVWSVILVVLTWAGGWLALGTVLGFAQFLQVAPALFTAYRTRLPSGISPATWWIAGSEGALWGYYGWFHGDLPIMIFAVTYVTTSALMLGRYFAVARPAKGGPRSWVPCG